MPIDRGDRVERGLRSPSAHVRDLGVQVALFCGTTGGDELNIPLARRLAREASGRVTVSEVANADHASAMRAAIPRISAFFSD